MRQFPPSPVRVVWEQASKTESLSTIEFQNIISPGCKFNKKHLDISSWIKTKQNKKSPPQNKTHVIYDNTEMTEIIEWSDEGFKVVIIKMHKEAIINMLEAKENNRDS